MTKRLETFTELYCRLFRTYRSAMHAGYVPTTRERAVIRYMRARVARRPVHSTGYAASSVSNRIHAACARASVRSELAGITDREIDVCVGQLGLI